MLDVILNLLIFVCTALCYLLCFRTEEGTWSAAKGLGALRYFTLLSNLFCALASLLLALSLLRGGASRALWLMKYIGTAAVTVTLLTVLVFLGPNMGYKPLLSGKDLYFHLFGPLLAIGSFCFAERFFPLSFAAAFVGLLPVLLYGSYYLYRVVCCPEGKRWEDFYGYNKDGKWPLAFTAMVLGTALICVLLWWLYRV